MLYWIWNSNASYAYINGWIVEKNCEKKTEYENHRLLNTILGSVQYRVMCLALYFAVNLQLTHVINGQRLISHIFFVIIWKTKKKMKKKKKPKQYIDRNTMIINNNNISWYRFLIQIFSVQSFIFFFCSFLLRAHSVFHSSPNTVIYYGISKIYNTYGNERRKKKLMHFRYTTDTRTHTKMLADTHSNKMRCDHDQRITLSRKWTIPIIILI